jgi:fido (protein-threonine AMPylation protein)
MPDPVLPAHPASYKWKEITDLPQDVESLRDRELESLSEVWKRERNRLGESLVHNFNAQLAREWAIETGIIEDVYTLDRGITQTLIERGIDASYIPHEASNRDPELVARIIQAHADVLEGLFAFVGGGRTLSAGYIKELHAALLRNQETVVVFNQLGQPFETKLEKGLYKRPPNNPMRADGTLHEYCPPEHVASEMDRLVQLHQQHDAVLPDSAAAWLHHAFTQIHPFQDGNGRVARSLASLVFIKRGFFPLVITRDDREKYISALELADQGDLSHLVRLFAQVQKRALTKAISKAVDVKPVASVEEALAATRDMLVDLGRIIPAQYLAAKQTAGVLVNQTLQRLEAVATTLSNDITRVNSAFSFQAANLGSAPVNDISTIAKKLQYDPNTNDFHRSIFLSLTHNSVAGKIVISFHGVGPAFRGLLVAVGYFQIGEEPPVPVCDDVFRISYQEPQAEAQKRYAKWLDDCLMRGLAAWRRTLV